MSAHDEQQTTHGSNLMTAPKPVASFVDSHPPEKQPEAWSSLWQRSITPWDRGEFSPALRQTLQERVDILGSPVLDSGKRRKALVPGCGRGWDVLLLASFGYDAYGLDVSATAIEACKRLEEEAGGMLPVENASNGKGEVAFVQGNFFEDNWLREIGVETFEIIYDYTFFCALNPTVRPRWATRMSELLKPSPDGRLTCLEWPRNKNIALGGPPFASPSAAYAAHLSQPGKGVSYDEPMESTNANGFEMLAHFEPKDTFKLTKSEAGAVEELIAIWQKRP